MSKKVEFFFDVGSPASYLAWTQMPELAKRHGAELVYRPMLLGGVFLAIGNRAPGTIEAKGNYMRNDLGRYAKRYAVPFRHNPHFPMNTLQLMRGATALLGTERFDDYLAAVFKAMWVDELNMADPALMASVLQQAGLDAEELAERISDPQVKAELKSTTEEAVARGVFGAPTFFVGDEMHFGQDRMEWVEEALAR